MQTLMPDTYENLVLSSDGPVAVIRLHRPSKKNALNARLRTELDKALRQVAESSEVRVLIITGGEDVFCAGADIEEVKQAASAESTYKFAKQFQILCDQVESLPQPVIAAISGYALGGGFELALACDLRIASETARFGLPEVKIGAVPGGGGTQRLPRLIGVARAKEMIFSGDPIDAGTALASGLLLKVVPKEKLLEEARAFAAKLSALPRLALDAAKKLINKGVGIDLTSALELELRSLAALSTSRDAREGAQAFLQKRKPNFVGE
jgi:enoyl-CoA hydratase